jgi:hypothetical protein
MPPCGPGCHCALQTGQYSTQIFSLAVLLSSLFVYNQMGGIDEAALDRLSLVTEMTKHIRVRASGGECRARPFQLQFAKRNRASRANQKSIMTVRCLAAPALGELEAQEAPACQACRSLSPQVPSARSVRWQLAPPLPCRAAGSSDTDASELASFTPSFLWLLRDFYLQLVEDGRKVTPRDYLETALQPLPGTGRAVEAKNQVRGPGQRQPCARRSGDAACMHVSGVCRLQWRVWGREGQWESSRVAV